MPEPRKPTLEEAVAWLKKMNDPVYTIRSIEDYRRRYGDAFAEAVRARVGLK